MPAPSKNWTNIVDTAIDTDSPVDQVLMTSIRDNLVHLREWLGKDYTAATNHTHDGVDSAAIEVGPNYARNGSFESDITGWGWTGYTGGSYAVSSSVHIHGAKSLAITSTVLANGGGDMLQSSFTPVAGGKFIPVEVWIQASVANVSSRAQIIWYDNAQSQISATNLADLTNTPTTFTSYGQSVQAPGTARYAKLKLIGGVPSAGSATGTIYFDGVIQSAIPNLSIVGELITNSAISQSKLKTTTSSGSVAVNSGGSASYSLSGGTYSWWTGSANYDAVNYGGVIWGNDDNAAGVIGLFNTSTGTARTFYVDERYVQASPPYRYGPLFVSLLLNPSGAIVGSQVAPDPIWAYHGPTDIRAQYYRNGLPYRLRRFINGVPIRVALQDYEIRRQYLAGLLEVTMQEQEITLAFKDTDASVIWHPFGSLPVGHSAILIRPGTAMMDKLFDIQSLASARDVRDLFLNDYLRIDNTTAQALPGMPAALLTYAARWRTT